MGFTHANAMKLNFHGKYHEVFHASAVASESAYLQCVLYLVFTITETFPLGRKKGNISVFHII